MQLVAITNHYNNYIFIFLLIINVYLEKQLGQLNYENI